MDCSKKSSGIYKEVDGSQKPASPVVEAASSASSAQYRLTDAILELRSRLELAMMSDVPTNCTEAQPSRLPPPSPLVATFRNMEEHSIGHAFMIRDILDRLTL